MTSKLQAKVSAEIKPAGVLIRDDILVWKPFPKAKFQAYTRFVGERACTINVNDPEPAQTVIAFLDQITEADLDSVSANRPLVVRAIQAIPGRSFDVAVIVDPSVESSSAIDKSVSFMSPVTYLTFPAFACEFTQNDDLEDAKYRIGKVGRVNWSREPFPVVAMRFQGGSGVRSTGGKGLLLFKPREADQTLKMITEEGGFMEVENFKREVVMIKQDSGAITLDIKRAGARPVATALVAPWFHSFLTEGADAADRKLRGS